MKPLTLTEKLLAVVSVLFLIAVTYGTYLSISADVANHRF